MLLERAARIMYVQTEKEILFTIFTSELVYLTYLT